MMTFVATGILAVSLLALPQEPDGSLVFEGGTVLDVAGGPAIEDAVVLVKSGRIAVVGRKGTVTVGDSATRIDARGKFLIPGLADMHVHVWDERVYPLFLASGVTIVRDCGGFEAMILGLRKRVADGAALGPRIFCVGPILDGNPPNWPFSVTPETEAEAVAAVDRLKAAGVDQLKVYSLLAPEIHRAICKRGREVGLKVTGHVPVTMNARQAVENGQDCIEHCDRFAATARGDAPKDPKDRASLFRDPWDPPDSKAVDDLVRFFVEKGTVVDPTMVVMHHLSILDTPEGRASPFIKYLPPTVTGFWDQSPLVKNPKAHLGFKSHLRFALDVVARLRKAGATLLVGTDSPNPYVVPGVSVAEELEFFVKAGHTPTEALAIATLGAARFLGIEKEWGSIAPGKIADIVVLDRDPRVDVSAVRSVAGISIRGQWLSREDLDRRLAALLPAPPADR